MRETSKGSKQISSLHVGITAKGLLKPTVLFAEMAQCPRHRQKSFSTREFHKHANKLGKYNILKQLLLKLIECYDLIWCNNWFVVLSSLFGDSEVKDNCG